MKAITTARTTHTAGDVGVNPLPVEVKTVGLKRAMTSVWVPEEEDLAVLRDAAHVGVLLRVYGNAHPEVSVKLVPLDQSPVLQAIQKQDTLTELIRLNLERENHALALKRRNE